MVNRMLNTITYPNSAPTPIQYHFASVNIPLDLSTSIPKVLLDPWTNCKIILTIRTAGLGQMKIFLSIGRIHITGSTCVQGTHSPQWRSSHIGAVRSSSPRSTISSHHLP
uniref:Uncharacterized protein n=1 Tax=Oryza brachyantha TaxID=4533 RepID=J3MSP8_ORYBR